VRDQKDRERKFEKKQFVVRMCVWEKHREKKKTQNRAFMLNQKKTTEARLGKGEAVIRSYNWGWEGPSSWGGDEEGPRSSDKRKLAKKKRAKGKRRGEVGRGSCLNELRGGVKGGVGGGGSVCRGGGGANSEKLRRRTSKWPTERGGEKNGGGEAEKVVD